MAASPLIPWAGCASVTRQGTVPHPMLMGDRLATRLPHHSSRISDTRPARGILWYSVAVALWAGGDGPAGSFGACTPPHRQLLCGVVGPSYPEQNEIQNFDRISLTSFCDCLLFIFAARPLLLACTPFGPRGQVTAPYATMVAATTRTKIVPQNL